MYLTLKELFNKKNLYQNREYNLKLWYLEIYSVNIMDYYQIILNIDLRKD
jgi:hypothetical protein